MTAAPFPARLMTVRLELAREPRHPAGEARIGYRMVAPLAADGRLDPALWRSRRDDCTVVHYRPDADDQVGHLVHRGHAGWAFRYDVSGDDDETGFRFEAERFVVGEYVSVTGDAGTHTFRVAAVGPA